MRYCTTDVRSTKGKERLAVCTAHDALFARWLEAGGLRVLLVGGGLETSALGRSPGSLTLEDALHHTAAVVRGSASALVMAELPQGLADDPGAAVGAGRRLITEGGAQAVSVPAGARDTLRAVGDEGLPFAGWLRAQEVHGAGTERLDKALSLAESSQAAGAFMVVVERFSPEAAGTLTRALKIPVVGFGSGPHCDGQLLMCEHLLGLVEPAPSYAKVYARLGPVVRRSSENFTRDVAAGSFPRR